MARDFNMRRELRGRADAKDPADPFSDREGFVGGTRGARAAELSAELKLGRIRQLLAKYRIRRWTAEQTAEILSTPPFPRPARKAATRLPDAGPAPDLDLRPRPAAPLADPPASDH